MEAVLGLLQVTSVEESVGWTTTEETVETREIAIVAAAVAEKAFQCSRCISVVIERIAETEIGIEGERLPWTGIPQQQQ